MRETDLEFVCNLCFVLSLPVSLSSLSRVSHSPGWRLSHSLAMIASNLCSSCLYFLGTGVAGACHHVQFCHLSQGFTYASKHAAKWVTSSDLTLHIQESYFCDVLGIGLVSLTSAPRSTNPLYQDRSYRHHPTDFSSQDSSRPLPVPSVRQQQLWFLSQ